MNSVVFIALLYTVSLGKYSVRSAQMRFRNKNTSRKVRTPLYSPYQTGMSLGAAVAVPLDNGRFDVFLSYCIASGFGEPEYDNPDGLNPPPFRTIPGETEDGSRKIRNTNAILTRRKFYRIFADNLKQNGFNGRHCLLKAICETSQHQFGDINGVLGDIVHILFTPTTSKEERLPSKFYEAEKNGHLNICNEKYKKCPVSVFDLITLIK